MNPLKLFIKKILTENYLTESEAYPFTFTTEGENYKYFFTIDDLNYICVIYPNPWQKDYYDVAFITEGGTVKDRIGKDLNFFNSVLKTIAECMKDFIRRKEVVRIIAFEGDRVREKAYVRFFKNHPYFSQFEIDDTHTKSGFVEIHVNKGIE